MTPLSSVSVATAVELFASWRVRYKFVATSIHSKAPDKMIRRTRMVRRDITLDILRQDILRQRSRLSIFRRRLLPNWLQRMILGELLTLSAAYLNRVTLITAPRSPSLPPSLG